MIQQQKQQQQEQEQQKQPPLTVVLFEFVAAVCSPERDEMLLWVVEEFYPAAGAAVPVGFVGISHLGPPLQHQ